MAQRIKCEFFLIRYVPDAVKSEFVNIGVVLRQVRSNEAQDSSGANPETIIARFTSDWQRVKAIAPHADIDLLNSLASELTTMLSIENGGETTGFRLLESLGETLSNAIQITCPKPCYAESMSEEIDLLAQLYVDSVAIEA